MRFAPVASGTAVITGASTGIGALYAERLAQRGHDVLLVARGEERLRALAARIAAETGRKADVLVADLTSKKELVAVEERIAQDGAIRMLVNNAGFNVGEPLSQADPDRLEQMVHLNAVVLTRLSRVAAGAFVARGGGTLINISSILAFEPKILNAAYAASKAYVLSLSQGLEHELGAKGLRVQAVLPGATRTGFWERFDAARDAFVAQLSRGVPAPRFGAGAVAV